MTVNSYLFQSPSPNQVQVGRLDPNSAQEKDTSSSPNTQNTALQAKADTFIATNTQEVKPTITANSIDVYA